MKATRFALSTILFFAINSMAGAEDEPPIPTDDFIYCTTCHGVQMMGNAIIKAPRLSGMDAWYVENQLNAFKKGWRGKHEADLPGVDMQPMASALSAGQIKEVAAYVTSTVSSSPSPTIEGDAANGKKLFSTCTACHGVNAEGNVALGSPPLTGLNDWYLVTQLEHFRAGIRGSAPGDIYGMQMRSSVRVLQDEQAVRDIVTYISTLQDH